MHNWRLQRFPCAFSLASMLTQLARLRVILAEHAKKRVSAHHKGRDWTGARSSVRKLVVTRLTGKKDARRPGATPSNRSTESETVWWQAREGDKGKRQAATQDPTWTPSQIPQLPVRRSLTNPRPSEPRGDFMMGDVTTNRPGPRSGSSRACAEAWRQVRTQERTRQEDRYASIW
jgi:hypothetical protein